MWRILARCAWCVPALGVAALALVPTDSLAELPVLCIFQRIFGVECPGCGFTRAFSTLLHGHVAKAVAMNKLVILFAPALAGVAIYGLGRTALLLVQVVKKQRR